MQKKKKYYINILFMLVLIGAVLYVLLKDQDLSEIIRALKGAKNSYIFLSAVAAITYVVMEGVSMLIILRSLNVKSSILSCVRYSFIGFFFNAITPSASGGQPMQVLYMHDDGINAGASSVTLLFWTIIYKIVLILFEGYVFIFHNGMAVKYLGGYIWLFVVGIVVNVVSILLYSIVVFSKTGAKNIVYFVTRLLHKLHIVKHKERIEEKLEKMLEAYQDGAAYMRTHIGTSIWVFITTLVQRIAYFAVTWFVYLALGGGSYSCMDIIILQSFVSVCIDILPFPGGVGANEGFFVALFAPVMGHSISVSSMLLSRGVSFYILVLISAVVSLYAQYRKIRRFNASDTI